VTIDGYNDRYDGSNNLDDNDDKSDGYNFLRSLFFPTELDGDSSETDLGVDSEHEGFYKRFLKDAVPTAGRSRIENNVDKNLVFFNFLLGESL